VYYVTLQKPVFETGTTHAGGVSKNWRLLAQKKEDLVTPEKENTRGRGTYKDRIIPARGRPK